MKQTELAEKLKQSIIAALVTAKAIKKAVPAIAKKIQDEELRDVIQGGHFDELLNYTQEVADDIGIKPKDLKSVAPEGIAHGVLCSILDRMKAMPRGGNEDLEVTAAFSRIAANIKVSATEQRTMAELLGQDDPAGALDNIREEMVNLAEDLEEMHVNILSLDVETPTYKQGRITFPTDY